MDKYIGAYKIIEKLKVLCDLNCPYTEKQRDVMCRACFLGDAMDVIDDMPAADVVEVVRCKDCKNWYDGERICYCKRFWDDDGEPKLYRCNANDYCSRGERKDG